MQGIWLEQTRHTSSWMLFFVRHSNRESAILTGKESLLSSLRTMLVMLLEVMESKPSSITATRAWTKKWLKYNEYRACLYRIHTRDIFQDVRHDIQSQPAERWLRQRQKLLTEWENEDLPLLLSSRAWWSHVQIMLSSLQAHFLASEWLVNYK